MLLIIHRSEREARPLADMLRYMGLLALHAKPSEALAEISTRYRAVLLLYPEMLPDAEDYLQKLRTYSAGIPFFAVSDALDAPYTRHFLRTLAPSSTAARIAEQIIAACRQERLEPPGVYRLGGIDASIDGVECRYMNRPLPLTATEARILRLLIRTYPERIGAASILRYVFSPTRRPQLSGVRTHICSINRKFRVIGESGALIDLKAHEGYRILTPIREERELLFL